MMLWRTPILVTALIGATALTGHANAETITVTHTLSYTETIPTSGLPYTYPFTAPAFDTALGTLTGVELILTNTATASVTVRNVSTGDQPFANATASVPLSVSGPGGLTVDATYLAGPFSGTVPSAQTYTFGPPYVPIPITVTVDGQTTEGGAPGSITQTETVPSSAFADYESATPLDLSYVARAGNGVYGGSGASGVIYFGGTATTGGAFTVTYTYTDTIPLVPEASTWVMLGLGSLGLAGYRSTRKSARFAV